MKLSKGNEIALKNDIITLAVNSANDKIKQLEIEKQLIQNDEEYISMKNTHIERWKLLIKVAENWRNEI